MPKKSPVEPNKEWLELFERELTQSVYARVIAYADRIASKLHALEGIDDRNYAVMLVLDAIGDTVQGIRAWDPTRRSLASHLCGVVQSRIYHDTKRAQRRRHIAYHEPDHADEQTGEMSAAETEMSLRLDSDRAKPDGAVTLAELSHRFCGTLRVLASNDLEVLALIESYATGCQDRADVMHRNGWSVPEFVNVRRRLNTVLGHLPQELLDDARETVTAGAATERSRAA